MTGTFTVRVTGVRSQNPRGFGGAIFTGVPIRADGAVNDAGTYVVVKATRGVLGGAVVEKGQWWEVSGPVAQRTVSTHGFHVIEQQMEADVATLARPSGEHIITFIAENPAFEGFGQVKARRLWDCFGQHLYSLLDQGDVSSLAHLLAPEAAQRLVNAWTLQGDSRTLQWLQVNGFDVRIGRKVLAFFGSEAPKRIEEDPYRLLSFCGKWSDVDKLARETFGVPPDDSRRLQGAVEEACYRLFASGHTAMLSSELTHAVSPLLGPAPLGSRWRDSVSTALSAGLSNGSFVVGRHGLQTLGALVMERQVAQAISSRLALQDNAHLLSAADVTESIGNFEALEGIQLNSEQQSAIRAACRYAFVCVTGGAGVGKTTVLKALYELYDRAGVRVVQVALAGRAAKRMQEATARPAFTIASFLKNYQDGSMDDPSVLVVDEASMADIISMSRICAVLPPHVRLVLVGDPNQLMPVGPGLVLHAVATVAGVPVTELKVAKRYGSEISAVADAVKNGRWPAMGNDETASVAFIQCDAALLTEMVVELYALDPKNTQVLSPLRNRPGGTKALNALCQERFAKSQPPVTQWSEQYDCVEHCGFHLGDVVMCARNMWDRGLQNGSLGTVVQVEDAPCPIFDESGNEAGAALAWVEWDDGMRRPLVAEMLDDVELGYAITVHKAQGSQWPRVIVPVTESRMLDRTLLYTAITRAQKQVILVGDPDAAQRAVKEPPRAHSRRVALDLTLAKLLKSATEATSARDAKLG